MPPRQETVIVWRPSRASLMKLGSWIAGFSAVGAATFYGDSFLSGATKDLWFALKAGGLSNMILAVCVAVLWTQLGRDRRDHAVRDNAFVETMNKAFRQIGRLRDDLAAERNRNATLQTELAKCSRRRR